MTARERAGSEWQGELSDGAAGEAVRPLNAGGPRYRLGGELGVGAMGRVRAAYDTLLEREIALKQVRARGDARAEAALLHEARVTAGLDHPAIIAVLDAGEDDDGQPFYAMRVVHGRSLDEVIAAGLDAAARTALVRAVLQVAQAMAYVHARGVVHRDLSPRNVRLGAHGEVVVMDWGLAARVDEAAGQAVVCGTPGYRGPELARGEPASPASDVWSLGALLHLVVVGTAPGAALPRRGLRAELRSLLARALAPEPAARYADAGALAADLAAFLDGGAVGAHRDRPWHRVARLARRHPGAIAAGTAGVAAVAVVAVVLGTLAVRRAGDARRSRGEARTALRAMIVERAGDAVRADRRSDAEALAIQARALGDVAAAAGVEAAFGAAPPVIVRPIADEAGCRTLDVRGGGERLCVADGRLWLVGGDGRRALDLEGGEPTAARFLADGGVIAASSVALGNRAVRFDRRLVAIGRHDLTGGTPSLDEAAGWALVGAPDRYLAVAADGSARAVRPCPAGATIRLVAADPSSTPAAVATVVWCSDGLLVVDGPGGVSRHSAVALGSRLPGAAAGVIIDGRLVVGGTDGRVGVVALPGGDVVHVSASPVGPVARIARGPGGDAIVIGDDGVGLWRPEVGAWRHVVSATEAIDAGVDGARVIAFGAGTLAAWEHAAELRTHRVTARAGLGAVAWSADSAQVAFGGGVGAIHVLTVATGQVRRATITDQVVKSLAFAPDGRTLAVGIATGHGLRALTLDDALVEQPLAWLDREVPVRRLAFVADDVVVAFTYGVAPVAIELGAAIRRERPTLTEPVVDASAADRGGAVFTLGTRGAVLRHDRDGSRALRVAAGATAIAVSGDGRVLALVDLSGAQVELRDAATDAARGGLAVPGAAIEDLALDPAGARLAVARIDGVVEVWRTADRRLLRSLRAHTGRAAALAFSPDGCALATAGWDAIGRVLALCQPGALQ